VTVAGSCIKCGTINDRSKWYAIADDAAQEEARQPKPAGPGRKPKAQSSAKRGDWYAAAGMEAPVEQDTTELRGAKVEGDVPISDNPEDWAEVSKGRRDPPFVLMGVGAVVLVALGGMFWYAGHGSSEPEAQQEIALPAKNVQWDHSYGYKVEPPEGFKQVQRSGSMEIDLPDFAKGLHGELTSLTTFRDAANGIDAYYFGEVRTDTNLDSYTKRITGEITKLTPLSAVPEGMKDYPTKGFLADMGARKALVYVAFAKPDRYLSVWVLAPSTSFAKVQSRVEEAARAFQVVQPNGPHPGTSFAAHNDDD
jgi:hypothetical protein